MKLPNVHKGPQVYSIHYSLLYQTYYLWAVVVAQLVEQSLPIPEVHGFNPVIGKYLFKLNICLFSTVYWKDENKFMNNTTRCRVGTNLYLTVLRAVCTMHWANSSDQVKPSDFSWLSSYSRKSDSSSLSGSNLKELAEVQLIERSHWTSKV